MPTAIQSLDILASEMPEIFETCEPASGWLDDWVVVPVDRPDQINGFGKNEEAINDPWMDAPLEGRSQEPPGFPMLNGPDSSYESFANDRKSGYAGAHLPPWQIPTGKGVGGHPPALPADCLAFYLPIHFFHPHWWGIYLLAEGVEYLAREIWSRHTTGANKLLSPRECRDAARIYLYWHEHYHHQVEVYSIRLEVTHRHTLYRHGFKDLYCRTFGTPDCLEETMAEVRAFRKTLSAFSPRFGMKKRERAKQERKRKALERAIISLIKSSPPGYREAAAVIRKRNDEGFQLELTECYHRAALPKAPRLSPGIWGNSPRLLHGFSNIRSRVNYLIPKRSSIASRIPLGAHPRIGSRELLRKLKVLVPGLEVIPPRGKHPLKIKPPGGRAIPIPVHPRDLSTGTLSSIIKQAGLDMSVRQFLEAI